MLRAQYDELLAIGEGGLFHTLAKKQQEMGAQDLSKMAQAHRDSSPSQRPVVVDVVEMTPQPRRRMSLRRGSAAPRAAARGTPKGKKSGEKGETEGDVLEANAAPKEKPRSYFKNIIALQRDSLWLIALGIIFAIGSGGAPLFGIRQLVGFFADLFQTSGDGIVQAITDRVLYMLLIIGITCGAYTLDSTCFGISASRLTMQMRRHAFTSFMKQDIGFFDAESNTAGELVEFLAEKVAMVEAITGGTLQAVVRIITSIIVLLVIVFKDGPWQLGLFLFVAFPLIMSCIMTAMNAAAGEEIKAVKGQESNSKAVLAEKNAGKLLSEVVIGIRTVASFNAEQRFYDEYVRGVDRVVVLDKKSAVLGSLAISATPPLFVMIFAAMYWYMGWLINERLATFEGGMLPMLLMMGVMMPFGSAALGLKDIQTANKAAQRFFETTSRASPINPSTNAGSKPSSVQGDLEVKDVVFAYPSAPEHLVCKGYSLTIPAGQTVALCGPSGSGKSTIIQLLERFYDPQDGVVMLDGVDIKTLNVKWLRSQLGLVGQEPVLFSGSVADNIQYGKEGATREEIEAAATSANAHTFIMENLANGYDTDVGQGGGKLSGGQKQRVAIARAIIKKPVILLLDEATSALDNESERIVQAALDEIMTKQKRTTVVIAHRLSTIRNADKIAVVREGKVVEQGSHDELLANVQGVYFGLVLAQSGDS